MTTTPSDHFTVDRAAIELAALFAVVLGVVGYLGLQAPAEIVAETGPPEAFGGGTTGEATAAGAWALAEVALAGAILALALVYQRLPEWIQDILKYNALVAIAIYVGAEYGEMGLATEIIVLTVGILTTYEVLDHFGVWWLVNNALAVVLAVAGGLVLGMVFGVVGMGLALLALTVYDHVFANKQRWMFTIGKAMLAFRLPLIFFRPTHLRLEWDDILDSFDDIDESDEESDGMAWGLGMADLMLPAGFVAAVASAPGQLVAGFEAVAVGVVILGALVACARLRFEMLSRGSGAGLPALSAGVLLPYAALVVVGAVV